MSDRDSLQRNFHDFFRRIKSLFRPPLLIAFLMSNKTSAAQEDAVCLPGAPPPPHFEGGCMSWLRDGGGGAEPLCAPPSLPFDPRGGLLGKQSPPTTHPVCLPGRWILNSIHPRLPPHPPVCQTAAPIMFSQICLTDALLFGGWTPLDCWFRRQFCCHNPSLSFCVKLTLSSQTSDQQS